MATSSLASFYFELFVHLMKATAIVTQTVNDEVLQFAMRWIFDKVVWCVVSLISS